MSASPHSIPKRKREQSEEAPMVRRSARQEAKFKPNGYPESVLERAMNLKKVQSLELTPPRSSRTSQQGSGPAVQADLSGRASVLQSATAATSGRMNKSRVSCCFTNDCVAFAGKNHIAEESPESLKPLVHASQGNSILSSKDKGLTTPPPTRVPKFDAQGKHSASRSTRALQTNACTRTLLSYQSCNKSSSETSDTLKHQDPHENNGPKINHIEKPMSSSKLGPCMIGNIKSEGIRSAMQADLASSAAAVKPASATSTRRVNRLAVAGVSSTTIHSARAASRSVAVVDPFDPNRVALNSRMISSLSSKDNDSTSPASTMVAARVASQGYQWNSIHSCKDKGLGVSPLPSPPMTCAPNVPANGRSSTSNAVPQSGADISKIMSTNSHTGGRTESNHVSQNVDHHKNNVVEKNNLNENGAARVATNLTKKSVQPSPQLNPTYYIRAKGSSELSTTPPLWPLGERCGLCGIDLAFMVKGSDSQSVDLPFSAVLPCRHSYHDACLRDVFGPVEPSCIRCLERVAPEGS